MTETIISAFIGAAGAVVVCLITQGSVLKRAREEMANANKISRDEMLESQKQSISDIKHEMELIRYMLDELTKHVEKHNQVIDRTYALEKRADVTEEQIKVINHRLEDLERKSDI